MAQVLNMFKLVAIRRKRKKTTKTAKFCKSWNSKLWKMCKIGYLFRFDFKERFRACREANRRPEGSGGGEAPDPDWQIRAFPPENQPGFGEKIQKVHPDLITFSNFVLGIFCQERSAGFDHGWNEDLCPNDWPIGIQDKVINHLIRL